MRRRWWVKEKKHMALLLITITMMLQFQMKGCVGCLETERIGLLQLKSYLNSLLPSPQEEGILEPWSDDASNSDCCLWERVKCSDAIGGHIVHLSLNKIFMGAFGSLNLSLLHSFPQLKTLDFSWNWFDRLFDPIHGYKSLQRLERLRTLHLSGNFLNNSVLPFLSAARSLRTLNLGENRMEGVFPPNELANMTELRVLNLQANKFSSFSVQGLINLRELEVLDLSGNRITDVEACDALKDMPKLQELDLTDNEFTDLDSLGVVFPSSLQVLKLGWNQLSSTLKGYSKICALRNLRELDLRGNALTNLPCCLGNLSRLRTLDLSENQLNGNLSSFVSGLPSALEYLSLLQNNFNGSFLFKSLFNQTRLTIFKLSSEVGMIQAQAESLWVPLFQLEELKLQNVSLGSTIPSFLVHQHELGFIDLSHNKLTGAFPTWLVRNNTRLHTLLLNNNSLTKLQLPRLVHGLQALNISSNGIQDSIQEDIGIVFPKLMYMDFSSNHFYGTIPSSMGEMKSLGSLNLSSNRLAGSIPDGISKLMDLVSLDLSNNKLDGNIPPQLDDLSSLGYFNVSFNDLSGEIPSEGYFRTFGEMSYIGNAHLCGFPTNKICNSERVREQSEEEGFMVWFCWTCGAVYISTLLALSAFLCIDTRWSREWFYRVDLSVHHLQRFKGRFVCN